MNDECKAAIGSKWEENCENIQFIIKTADELMYADKKNFIITIVQQDAIDIILMY